MEINVLIDEGVAGHLDVDWLRRIAERTLIAQNAPTNVELGLVTTTQEKIQELNRIYLGRDAPTDVLAFPMQPDIEGTNLPTFVTPPDGLIHLGEVIISYPQAVMQAKERQHSVKREIAILIIHGVLHLWGYKDDTPDSRREMQARQAAILSTMEVEAK